MSVTTSHPVLTEDVHMLFWHRVLHTKVPHIKARRRARIATAPRSWTDPALRCVLALGLVAAFTAIGIGAALRAWGSPVLLSFEVCCLVPLLVVVNLELRPALIALWDGMADDSGVIRDFRRELEALPETSHPLEA